MSGHRARMSGHRAWVEWTAQGEFASGQYSRRHQVRFDGGAEIVASASPDIVPAPLSDPAGVDPEEMLVAAVASCHMLWFLSLAQQAGHSVSRYSDAAAGEMGRIEPGRFALTRITLRPDIAFAGPVPAAETLARLHEAAHERCFIANSLKTEVVVEPL